jgi:hypothetical protein
MEVLPKARQIESNEDVQEKIVLPPTIEGVDRVHGSPR